LPSAELTANCLNGFTLAPSCHVRVKWNGIRAGVAVWDVYPVSPSYIKAFDGKLPLGNCR
jgi:hypothetical protein